MHNVRFFLDGIAHSAHIPLTKAHSVLSIKPDSRLKPNNRERQGKDHDMLVDMLMLRAAMRSQKVDLKRSGSLNCRLNTMWRKAGRLLG